MFIVIVHAQVDLQKCSTFEKVFGGSPLDVDFTIPFQPLEQ